VTLGLALACLLTAAPPTLLYETGDIDVVDARELAQNVSIYTRDLGMEVEVRSGAPTQLTAKVLGEQLALVDDSPIAFAFWVQERTDPPGGDRIVLYAVRKEGDHASFHAIPCGKRGDPGLARVVALKVRALLIGGAQEPPPPSTTPLPPPEPERAPLPVPVTQASVIPEPAPGPVAAVAVGYVLTVPHDVGLLRQGLLLEGALRVSPRWEMAADVEVTSEPARTVSTGIATLSDVPIRVIGRRRWLAGPTELWAGPQAALHVLSVSGFGFDGTQGTSVQAAAGLGGEAGIRFGVGQSLRAEIRLGVEQVLPDLRFDLHGSRVFDAGGFIVGACFALQLVASGGPFSTAEPPPATVGG
jgi:hypothetical protein